MDKKSLIIIVLILLSGILFRLLITWDGNFIFNMDNARDFLDVREIVVLHKFRLIGPTSGIEGFFNGPGWYYLLAAPFFITQGDPFSGVVLMIILWTIGGYFLLKLLYPSGWIAQLSAGLIWISGDYLTLVTSYSYNPNPVVLLTPLFLYLLKCYLDKDSIIYGIGIWFLAGMFFNFEMAAGIFIPLIILLSILISGRIKRFRSKSFWIGLMVFVLLLLPQILFEMRHNFFMSNSVLYYLNHNPHRPESFFAKTRTIYDTYLQVARSVVMNGDILVKAVVALIIISILRFHQSSFRKNKTLIIVILLTILIPFTGHLLMPAKVMIWHLGSPAAAFVCLIGVVTGDLYKQNRLGKLLSLILVGIIIFYSSINIGSSFRERIIEKIPSMDPSNYHNQMKAVDYVYQYAQGKDFKVYSYIPSVIDYSYQYLFWWVGLSKYNYSPKEYAYLPNMPPYIKYKDQYFSKTSSTKSNLIFLIKERNRPDLLDLWENNFRTLPTISRTSIGPLDIEVKQDLDTGPLH